MTGTGEQIGLMVRRAIEEDPHTSICDLSTRFGLSRGTIEGIINEHLHKKKVCARWKPYLLTEEQKKQILACSKNLLGMFGPDGIKRLCDIVIRDEIWTYVYDIPNKRYNQMWVDKNKPRPVVLRQGFQNRKLFFYIF